MIRRLAVGIVAGILFAFLDGLINANPLGARLLSVYHPITRDSIAVGTAVAIDLFFGVVMALVFEALSPSLPGRVGWTKGLSFGLLAWFFRVLMSAASSWVMFEVLLELTLYVLATGLAEMLAIGLFLGAFLRPGRSGAVGTDPVRG